MLSDPTEYSLLGSSVHGIFQARILKRVAIYTPGESSQPRDWTQVSWVSCTGRYILYHCAIWEAHLRPCTHPNLVSNPTLLKPCRTQTVTALILSHIPVWLSSLSLFIWEWGTAIEVQLCSPFAWQSGKATLSFSSKTLCISVGHWCTESQDLANTLSLWQNYAPLSVSMNLPILNTSTSGLIQYLFFWVQLTSPANTFVEQRMNPKWLGFSQFNST